MPNISLETIHAILERVERKIDITNGNVKKNTEHRIISTTTFKNFKWLIGFIGGGTVINIAVSLFSK